jgi:hypothetical protein
LFFLDAECIPWRPRGQALRRWTQSEVLYCNVRSFASTLFDDLRSAPGATTLIDMKNLEKVLATYSLRRQKLSQSEIARESGASISIVNDVESGRRRPCGQLLRWLGWERGYIRVRNSAYDSQADIDSAGA